LSLNSCSKRENLPDFKAKQIQKTMSQSIKSGHQELLNFLNISYYVYQKINTEGNIKELEFYLNKGIDNSNIHKVALVMGFDDFEHFKEIFIKQKALANVIDKQLHFSDLTEKQKLEVINKGLGESKWNLTVSSDDCEERYNLCVIKALATQVVATAGCATLGPFAVPCGVAAAAYAAAEVEGCQLDYNDCRK